MKWLRGISMGPDVELACGSDDDRDADGVQTT
jgi:hypothetical protein